jgi:hypothetical protein
MSESMVSAELRRAPDGCFYVIVRDGAEYTAFRAALHDGRGFKRKWQAVKAIDDGTINKPEVTS